MHQLAACQDRIRCNDFLPIDSAEGSREQTELLHKHGVVIDHDQVSNIKYMRGEDEDKLEGQSR